ncbi:MAG: peptidoglycan recognition protein family protein [Nanoarchaeota archaeon]|nr:peptidoglycan recognition protein family protein [Nanoarchaeota archaeon]MBU4308852.1 peptidoglycan recognition protein family protein [Nanoarchaeota archaeon]
MEHLLKVEKIVVHHSEQNQDCAEFIKVRHKKRGWEDIGYHFVIEKNGQLKKGRDEKFVGAHIFGYNKNSIGICLTGNFDENFPTQKQMKTLLKFLKKKLKEYGLEPKDVVGHREFPGVKKTCPGKKFNMDGVRSKLKN